MVGHTIGPKGKGFKRRLKLPPQNIWFSQTKNCWNSLKREVVQFAVPNRGRSENIITKPFTPPFAFLLFCLGLVEATLEKSSPPFEVPMKYDLCDFPWINANTLEVNILFIYF